MVISNINATLLKKAFLAGAARLESQKEKVNELNVFPVPDGDTGTNMTLTIMSAVKAVNSIDIVTISSLARAMSSGSLRGARGNSGVILSQLLRGFCKEITENETIDIPTLVKAFNRASETAYKAVMKPKEGTILTVARGGSDKATELLGTTDDIVSFIGSVVSHMEKVLNSTPEMLPVLKEAGVVDSGGAGLLEIMKGAYAALNGEDVPLADGNMTSSTHAGITGISNDIETADIKFGYCTEFIINAKKEFTKVDELNFKRYLEDIGDCIVVVSDYDIVKVHVHTNDPGLAIQKALTYGELTNMKIDNMREEHRERVIMNSEHLAKEQQLHDQLENIENTAPPEGGDIATVSSPSHKQDAFITIASGSGLIQIFKDLGVDYVIEGGQTMNPSTDDMLDAISKLDADNIFILPNNKNIILAANQAKELTTDKNIIVIPTKTIPQGIACVINYIYEGDVKENEIKMLESIASIKSGEVTYAIRDTTLNGRPIKKNDIMGIGDDGIISVCNSVNETVLDMLDILVDDDSSLISLYYGDNIKEKDANALLEKIKTKYPDFELELNSGGQPVYYYILSVE